VHQLSHISLYPLLLYVVSFQTLLAGESVLVASSADLDVLVVSLIVGLDALLQAALIVALDQPSQSLLPLPLGMQLVLALDLRLQVGFVSDIYLESTLDSALELPLVSAHSDGYLGHIDVFLVLLLVGVNPDLILLHLQALQAVVSFVVNLEGRDLLVHTPLLLVAGVPDGNDSALPLSLFGIS
jgi:hypothetical protein